MEYLFALIKDNNIIGLFNNKKLAENMMNGLINNKFCKSSKLTIFCYATNSIFKIEEIDNIVEDNEIDNNNDDIDSNNIDSIEDISPEEKKKINEEKSKIEYEMNLLKKKKEKIIESKKTYKVDLDLYKKFKKIVNENPNFEIPDLFHNKYSVFKMLDEKDKLNWENFYANYKKEEINTGYNQMFGGQSAREELNL
jgi:hypothetical protein